MRIEEIIARKTHRGYLMVQLREKSAEESRWQILNDAGGMKCHQGFVATEEAARTKIDELLSGKNAAPERRRGF